MFGCYVYPEKSYKVSLSLMLTIFLFQGDHFSQEISVENKALPLVEKLINGFGAGSSLYTEIKLSSGCDNFALNLESGKSGQKEDISLHFNPRLGRYTPTFFVSMVL